MKLAAVLKARAGSIPAKCCGFSGSLSCKRSTKYVHSMLNLPCNPTGGTCNRAQLEAIAKFVVEKDLLVLSDEIYSELTFEGEHVSIATFPGMKERTIFLHGFSKAFAMPRHW